jgi:hypothetical protein
MIKEILIYSDIYQLSDLIFKSSTEVSDIYYECLIPVLKRVNTLN